MKGTHIITPNEPQLSGISLVGKRDIDSAVEGLSTHLHPGAIEIVYLHKGIQYYDVENQLYRVYGGDIFITFPDEYHSTAEYPQEKSSLYWIQLDLRNTDRFLGLDRQSSSVLIAALKGLKRRHFKGNATCKRIIDDILKAYRSNNELKYLIICHLVQSFLLLILDCEKGCSSFAVTDDIARAVRLIDTAFHERLSIDRKSVV